jgi:hypothetical protein
MNDEVLGILRELVDDEPINTCADDGMWCLYCGKEITRTFQHGDVCHHADDCIVTKARNILKQHDGADDE